MAEELQKNVPDYLMNTNSSLGGQMQEEIKSAHQEYEQNERNQRPLKDNENMPRIIIKEPLGKLLGHNGSGGFQLENSGSQIDLTDLSEEIISIEDTYRETNATCRKSIEESE